MRAELLKWLQCRRCGSGYVPSASAVDGPEIISGELRCCCPQGVPVLKGIPRFVPSEQYTASFGFEWTRHRQTQLDSFTGRGESARRLRESSDFPLDELCGKLVLDAGCGAGRFAEVVADHGGTVVGVDLSLAVEAASRNLAGRENVHLLQADLHELPFAEGTFDVIYSLGVLHHTPSPERAFMALPGLLKPGGKISITVYSSYQKIFVYNSRFWRAITTRLPRRVLYYLCFSAVPLYYLYRIPVLGDLMKMFFLISLHPDWRWRVLDTFDWYSPAYQHWFTHHEVFQWFDRAGLRNVKVLPAAVSLIGERPR